MENGFLSRKRHKNHTHTHATDVVTVKQINVAKQDSATPAFPTPIACPRAALTQGINNGSVEKEGAAMRITTARTSLRIMPGSLKD
jgi:hypothetical protein